MIAKKKTTIDWAIQNFGLFFVSWKKDKKNKQKEIHKKTIDAEIQPAILMSSIFLVIRTKEIQKEPNSVALESTCIFFVSIFAFCFNYVQYWRSFASIWSILQEHSLCLWALFQVRNDKNIENVVPFCVIFYQQRLGK